MFGKTKGFWAQDRLILKIMLIFLTVFYLPTLAQKIKEPQHPLDFYSFSKEELNLTMQGKDYRTLGAELSVEMLSDIEKLKADSGSDQMLVMIDKLTGKPSLIEGGIPWIPGTGIRNKIQPEDIGASAKQAIENAIPIEKVDQIAKDFLKKYPSLFNINPDELELAKDASGPMLDYLYNVNYRWTYNGLPVENAWLNFHLNSGNLSLFGATYICDTIKKLDTTPTISLNTAWQVVLSYINDQIGFEDEILEPGMLIIQPVLSSPVLNGSYYEMGTGMEYRLVYVMIFRKNGVIGDWEARVDAHTGELISFKDINAYGHIQGGVFKTDKNPTQTEVIAPFPYANYSGTTSFADINGDFSGTTGTSTLTGRTGSAGNVGAVKVSTDYCGSISLAADASGLINFGTSSGTDCTTPGVGGAGNTHSARTQYWNQTMLKIKAYTYIPGNTWLQACQNTEVNYASSCNAYWTGGATGYSRFFRSSSNCGNTGELPGVSLHEFGHGFDYNDGNGFSPDGGTGEVYGDTTAMLQTRQSCMGGGFWKAYNTGCGAPPSQGSSYHNCTGYGNCCTDCSGVRDVDYAKHVQSTTPATLTFAKACSTSTCQGPCGRECHCESYVGTESNWDLVNRDLVTWGLDVSSAWQLFDKLWYASAPNRLAAYVCTTNASTGTGNLFNQYRLIDDCDGDPSNGTPHASAIWNALSRHQIGNSAANNTDNNCGCASLSKPNLNGSAGNGSVTLTWSAISGASSYDIFRNETSCNSGFTKVGNTTSTSFTDTPLVNGVTYYYTIQAKGTGSCPPSPVSNCVTLTPNGTSCAAPTGLTNNSAVDLDGCADTGVRITWTADPSNWGDGGSGTRTYNVLRNGTSIGGNISYGTTQYTDTTGTNGTSYTYTVRYNNGCGLNATTTGASAADNVGAAPSSLTNNTATDLDTCADTGVRITWSVDPGNWGDNGNGTRTYDVLRGGTAISSNMAYGTTQYTDTTGTNGTSYTYTVRYNNGCGLSATTTGVSATDNVSHIVDVTPNGTTSVCTGTNIVLTASALPAGSYTYQWTEDGSDISGQTSSTLTITKSTAQSHTYNCKVTGNGCTVQDSTSSTGSWIVCAPNIVYQTSGNWTQITGDGDAYFDLGEKWSVDVTLTNTGSLNATNVFATLSGNGIEVCEPNKSFGNIPVSGTGSATFEFVISPTFTPCGGSIGFDVISKISSETSPAGIDEMDVFSINVGKGSGGGTVTLFAADDAPYTSGYWTWGGGSSQTAVHCSHSDAYGRLNQDTYCTLNPGLVSTVGYKNITVVFDWITFNMESGDYLALQYYNGTSWVDSGFSTLNNAAWICGQSVNLPADAEEVSNFQIRFRAEGNSAANNERAGIDYVFITGDTENSADCSYIGFGTCAICTPPSQPAITNLTDSDACAQSGITITFTSGSPATRHDLYRDSSLVQSNITSPYSYIPGDTSSHSYVIRAINGDDSCYTDSSSYAFTDANDSVGTPTISSVVDVDACATSGVSITWGAVSGATGYDLSVDGATVVTNVTSPYTYQPGNNTSHNYEVRAKNASCTGSWSTAVAGTDANISVGTPTISSVTDVDPCATSGVSITWGAVSGATGYDLRVDGVTVVTNVTSPYTYQPGNNNSHNYEVRAKNASCTGSWSAPVAGTDANGTPSAPVITSIVDIDPNNMTGIQVNYTSGSPATQHDLYKDGGLAVANYVSGSTYLPGDTLSHSYVVRAVNGSCYTDSAPVNGTDAMSVTPPPEVATGTNYSWPTANQTSQTMGWNSEATATGYRVYRGTKAQLPALCDGTQDFCKSYDGSNLTYDASLDDPATIDSTNKVVYYLIVAYNPGGEGPSGTATCGTRQINNSCP